MHNQYIYLANVASMQDKMEHIPVTEAVLQYKIIVSTTASMRFMFTSFIRTPSKSCSFDFC